MTEAAARQGPWGERSDVVAEAASGAAQRTHPLSIVTGFISTLPQMLYAIPALLVGGSKAIPYLIFAIPAILLFAGAARWLAWRHFSYRIGADDIRVDHGVLRRQSRSIPFERIQDVGLEQKPVARLLGLAAVKIETGGGKGEDAELSYLKLADAEALRDLIRDRKHSALDGPDVAAETAAAADRSVETTGNAASFGAPLFAMDNRRLLLAGLFNFSLVVIAAAAAFFQQFQNVLSFDIYNPRFWLGMLTDVGFNFDIGALRSLGLIAQILTAGGAIALLIAIGVLSGIVRTTLREYGFRLDRVPAGFRRRRGLLTLTDVVLPAHRVQAGLILSGPIRRHFGWRELKFQSLAQDGKGSGDHNVAPLAHPREILPILAEAGLENSADPGSYHRAMLGPFMLLWSILALLLCIPATVLLFLIPLAAPLVYAAAACLPVLAWLRWKHHRHVVHAGQLYVQTGWWRQRLTLLPMVKTQSIDLTYSPIDRLFGTNGLVFGVAGGSSSFPLHLRALPEAEAVSLRDRIMAAVAQVDFSEMHAPR